MPKIGEINGHLTILEFRPGDFPRAKAMARGLGFGDSSAYLTTSSLPGLYCLPTHKGQTEMVICKTAELGFIAVQTMED